MPNVQRPPRPAARNALRDSSDFARRIQHAVGVVLAALFLTAGLAMYGVVHLLGITERVVGKHANDLYQVQELRIQAQSMVAADRAFLLTRDPRYAETVGAAHAEFQAIARLLAERSVRPEGRRMLSDMVSLKERHAQAVRRLLTEVPPQEAREAFTRDVVPLTERLQDQLENYTQTKRRLLDEAEASAVRAARATVAVLAVVILASVLTGVAVWIITGRALARIAAYQRELHGLIETRDLFIAAVGHELRTPLSVLRLNVDLLRRRWSADPDPDPDGARRLSASTIDMLDRNVGVVVSLVDRLLDVSLMDSGQLKLDVAEMDLSAVAREAARRVDTLVSDRLCRIQVEAPVPVLGKWDPIRIGQVIDNLLSNAVRHAGGGPIALIVEAGQDLARIRVRDQGSGLSPAAQERIFDPFVRLGPSRDGSGMGLGLSIVRDIVHAHGGTIHVESEPDVGSCFVVELPRQR